MNMKQFPVIDPIATGKNIIRLRVERGMSVRDLQAYFGFEEPQAIYKWQQGKSLLRMRREGNGSHREAGFHDHRNTHGKAGHKADHNEQTVYRHYRRHDDHGLRSQDRRQ